MCIVLAQFLSCTTHVQRSVRYYLYKRKNIAVWPLLMCSPFAFGWGSGDAFTEFRLIGQASNSNTTGKLTHNYFTAKIQ